MNKTLLIFRHEFRHTIKRTGFIVLTLAPPLLILLGIGVYDIVSGITKPPTEVIKIGYVDEAGGFNQFTTQGDITLVRFDTPEGATQALVAEDVKEYFVIPSDFISTGIIRRYTTQRELGPPVATTAAIKNFTSSNLLAGKVPATTAARIEAPLNLVTTTLTATGTVAPEQGGFANLVIPGIFSALLAASLMFSSTYLLQGLGAEKENRTVEVLLLSLHPRQLMMGKILGLSLVTLVQLGIWFGGGALILKRGSCCLPAK